MDNETVPTQLAVRLTKNSAFGIAFNEAGINEHETQEKAPTFSSTEILNQ